MRRRLLASPGSSPLPAAVCRPLPGLDRHHARHRRLDDADLRHLLCSSLRGRRLRDRLRGGLLRDRLRRSLRCGRLRGRRRGGVVLVQVVLVHQRDELGAVVRVGGVDAGQGVGERVGDRRGRPSPR